MSDVDLTAFEEQFERRLRRHADITVQPIDAGAIALSVVAGGRRRTLGEWLGLGVWRGARPVFGSMTLLIILGLVLALVVAIVVGSALRTLPTKAHLGRNGLIAYELWDIDSRPYTHLHLMKPDGTDDHEIGQGAGPSFAKDGKTIAYSTGYGLGAPEQRLLMADGDFTNPRDIAPYLERGFAFSPDAKQFVVNEADALWLISTDDGTRTLLVPAPDEPTVHFYDMTWSPDSKSIAYSVMEDVTNGDNSGIRRVGLEVLDLETRTPRHLTARHGTDGTAIKWSPDGTRVAYLGLPDGSPEPSLGTGEESLDSWWLPEDVFIVNADGTGDRNVTNTPTFEQQPELSPDGRSLAFATFVDPDYRIAIVDVSDDTSGDPGKYAPNGELLFRVGPAAAEFEWSPNGKQLVLRRLSDVSPPGAERQSLRSTISVIDAAFETPEQTILEVDHNVGSLAWQWLEP